MMQPDAIARIVDALDERPLHGERWQAILDQLVAATGSRAALLIPITGRVPGQLKTAGADELEAAYFADGWNTCDLRERGLAKMSATGVTVDQDFMTREAMRRHPYYTAFLEPLGFRFFAGLGVRVDESQWALTLQRGRAAEPFSADEQRALHLVQGRLQNAAQVENLLASSYAEGRLDALHQEGTACLMLDARGHVLFANEPAERMVGSIFAVRRGRICLASQKQDKALDAYIAAHLARRVPGVRLVPDHPERPRAVFEALRLPRLETPFSRFAVALRIRRLATSVAVGAEDLRQVFDLSSREAGLLAHLCAVPDLAETAAALGIAAGTARAHLKSIFAKTGTHKQAEVLALAASLVRG